MKEAWEKTQLENWNDFVEARPRDWNGEPMLPSRNCNYIYMMKRVDSIHREKVKQAVISNLPVPSNVRKEYKI